MPKRVFVVVLDSFGIGEEPDAAAYGDEGSNTLCACATSGVLNIPNMTKLGLLNIDGALDTVYDVDLKPIESPEGAYARMQEKSAGKDTTVGHWEMAGVISPKKFPTYPDGFPQEVIEEFEQKTGRKVLCNKPYSGTDVIRDFGKEHVETGALIVYTSADSVFQIAAHEDVVSPEKLYEYCRIAREILQGEHGVARNSVTSMGVSAAARDITTMRTYADTYGVAVAKTGDVTNQRQSGRCWMFSSFNVLRQEAIKKLDVDTFEFSQAYGMFYDKLEKANSALEYIIQTADQPTDSRVVNTLLTEGIGDGGYYSFAMSLVEKYGLVPKDAMPETACSKNSTQMDERIDRLFRKSAGELRAAYAAGKSLDELRALKQEQLKGFHWLIELSFFFTDKISRLSCF